MGPVIKRNALIHNVGKALSVGDYLIDFVKSTGALFLLTLRKRQSILATDNVLLTIALNHLTVSFGDSAIDLSVNS